MLKKLALISSLALFTFTQQAIAFSIGNVISNSGEDLVKAATLSEEDVITESRAAVEYLDTSNNLSEKNGKASKRLDQIVSRIKLPEIDGVLFNFKVYETADDDVNAFATPDGSIRVNSGLMKAMSDDQVLAVLGHEIGHVVEKHSFKQMKKALLASAAIRAAAGESQIGTVAYNAGMGEIMHKFAESSFSKSDELSADKYSLKVLKEAGAKPDAMLSVIKFFQDTYGDSGGMLSSHPSNKKRLKKLQKAIDQS